MYISHTHLSTKKFCGFLKLFQQNRFESLEIPLWPTFKCAKFNERNIYDIDLFSIYILTLFIKQNELEKF